jgi:hypothetical protein
MFGVDNADLPDREFADLHLVEFSLLHSKTTNCKSGNGNCSYCRGARSDSDAAINGE